MTSALADDPRWQRLLRGDWKCRFCGDAHVGVFDLACDAPVYWTGPDVKCANSEVHGSDTILTEDMCVIGGEHFFIRGVLELPILGSGGMNFGYGVWSSVSKPNFELYVDTFDDGHQADLGPWFGWFSTGLKGYPDTTGLKCNIVPGNGRQRPKIVLQASDHPLAAEQRDGISFDRLLDIYALNGHDIRSDLAGKSSGWRRFFRG